MSRRDNHIGVLLYLPPTLRGSEIQAQGLVRHALTVTAALNVFRPDSVTILVPRWARDQACEALSRLSTPCDLPVKVTSPNSKSPAELLTRILVWSADRIAKKPRTSTRRLPRFRSVLSRLTAVALSSWIVAVISVGTFAATLTAIIGCIWFLFDALQQSTDGAALRTFMLTAVIAVALGAAWLGTISMRSTKDGNRNSYLSRGLRIASLGMQTARASLVMTLEKADVAFFVRKANRMGITCWWMPIGMYSGLAHVNGRKIITFADFSPREFPSMILDQPVMSKRGEEMAVALDSSDVIVCLSEHVATHHLPALLPSPKGRVLVIPPGPPNRREKSAENHSHGIAVLTERLKEDYPSSRATIADWWTMPTIVIPTQNRPYKNLHTIVRAVRILNVERFLRVRVIFTCHPEQMKMGDFVENLGCNSFIEFLPNLDDETLDLVIEHSSLAVSPSLFEGSLPYTFYEAVSLGTPCLLADIPVTRAATKGHDAFRQRSVFDPHHPQSVADAIEGCLEDLEGLKILQSLFLADYYDEHSWPRTAERYWRAFDETGMSEQPIKKKLGRG